MERPPEFLKSFANRLGRLAAEEDGLRLLRRLHLTDILGAGPDAARTAFPGGVQDRVSPGATASGKVGIWEKKEEAGKAVFVRSPHAIKTWHYWADVERIGPKGSKRRIILTGESVARGYLYDPEYTPAMVLEKVLESELGKDEVEVIDLARN